MQRLPPIKERRLVGSSVAAISFRLLNTFLSFHSPHPVNSPLPPISSILSSPSPPPRCYHIHVSSYYIVTE
jgi:hypothetical protein